MPPRSRACDSWKMWLAGLVKIWVYDVTKEDEMSMSELDMYVQDTASQADAYADC